MTRNKKKELAEFTLGFIMHRLGDEDADLDEVQEVVCVMHRLIDEIVNSFPEELQESPLSVWLKKLFRKNVTKQEREESLSVDEKCKNCRRSEQFYEMGRTMGAVEIREKMKAEAFDRKITIVSIVAIVISVISLLLAIVWK